MKTSIGIRCAVIALMLALPSTAVFALGGGHGGHGGGHGGHHGGHGGGHHAGAHSAGHPGGHGAGASRAAAGHAAGAGSKAAVAAPRMGAQLHDGGSKKAAMVSDLGPRTTKVAAARAAAKKAGVTDPGAIKRDGGLRIAPGAVGGLKLNPARDPARVRAAEKAAAEKYASTHQKAPVSSDLGPRAKVAAARAAAKKAGVTDPGGINDPHISFNPR